jgi:DNA-binding SARP family transcriptional activator/TolB-like protein
MPSPPRLRLSLLGTMAAVDENGRSLLPRGRKTRAVLAVLALASPDLVPRSRMTALLWSRRDREQARASLRQCVHELQDILAPLPGLFVAERDHLMLKREDIATDLDEPDLRLPPARLLADMTGLDGGLDRFLATERLRLTRAASARLEAAMAAQTQPEDVLATATRILAIDPANERAWRATIRAHALAGSRAEAALAYDRCVATLAEIARVAPGEETQALIGSIRRGEPLRAIRPQQRKPGARLGVMPFRAAGGDDGGLSLGLAEEITAALARFRWLFLIASPSLATLAEGDEARWHALDLDFLLDGTVQHGQGRVRITQRLLDMRAGEAGAGEVVWSGRFDREAGDLFALQDEIAAETVARIDPTLLLREGQRAGQSLPHSATAYDLTLRAIPAIYRLEERSFRAAGEALARAVALDPDYASAHAWWACWYLFLVGQGWADDRLAAMTRAGELAERAVSLDPADARGLTIAGHVRAFLHGEAEDAILLHERALSLNPNLPLAWVFSGLAHTYVGQHAEAIRRIGQAKRLSPFDPHAFFFDGALMIPHLLLGHYEQVVEIGRRAIALNPGLSTTYKAHLAALGFLGRHDEAAVARARLAELDPGFGLREAAARTTLRRAQDNAHYLEGLRRGGLGE